MDESQKAEGSSSHQNQDHTDDHHLEMLEEVQLQYSHPLFISIVNYRSKAHLELEDTLYPLAISVYYLIQRR